MEEVYHYLPDAKKTSPQLEDMPQSKGAEETLLNEFATFKALRDVALKELERARAQGTFGRSSDAALVLTVKDPILFDHLSSLSEEQRAKIFIVASVDLKKGEEDAAEVSLSSGELCPRCRFRVKTLVPHGEHCVCPRCAKALEELA